MHKLNITSLLIVLRFENLENPIFLILIHYVYHDIHINVCIEAKHVCKKEIPSNFRILLRFKFVEMFSFEFHFVTTFYNGRNVTGSGHIFNFTVNSSHSIRGQASFGYLKAKKKKKIENGCLDFEC